MAELRNGGVKTLGIKVPDALHAQFALVAQLDGISLGDAALRAVELYVTTKKAEPDFAARAQAALEEIEREVNRSGYDRDRVAYTSTMLAGSFFIWKAASYSTGGMF